MEITKTLTFKDKRLTFNNKLLTFKNTPLPFTFTIDTNNITGTDYNLVLSTQSTDLYDATVDWGDGTQSYIDSYNSSERFHTYGTDGIYTIRITGRMDKLVLGGGTNVKKDALISIDEWGNTNEFKSISSLCSDCINLVSVAPITNKLEQCITTASSFQNCTSLTSFDLSDVNLPNVLTMASMFRGCNSMTSIDFTNINTPNLDNAQYLVQSCTVLTDIINIKHLNVSNVTTMLGLFNGCSSIQTIDLTGWDTENVLNIRTFFDSCTGLTNIIGLGDLYLPNCTDTSFMFRNCSSIESLNLSTLGLSSIQDTNRMFDSCTNLVSVNVSGWNVSNITTIEEMFRVCTSLQEIIGIDNWNISSNLRFARAAFISCSSLTSLDLSNWDVSGVEQLSTTANASFAIFQNCTSLETLDLTGWSLSSIVGTAARGVFIGCSSLTTISGITNLINNRVTNLENFFVSCSSLVNIDLSGWDTSNVTIFSSLFQNCTNLTSLDLSNWDTSKIGGSMTNMFRSCDSLQTLNITGWDLSTKTIDTGSNGMFNNCPVLEEIIGISGTTLNPSNTTLSSIFQECNSINNLNLSNWDTSNVTSFSSTFNNCLSLTNLNIDGWSFEGINVTTGGPVTQFLNNVTLDTSVYDSILINIASQNVISGLSFNGGLSKYSSAAQSARDFLTVDKSWTISDGGLEV